MIKEWGELGQCCWVGAARGGGGLKSEGRWERDLTKCRLKQPNHVIRMMMNSLTIHFAYTCDGCYIKPWTTWVHRRTHPLSAHHTKRLLQFFPKLSVCKERTWECAHLLFLLSSTLKENLHNLFFLPQSPEEIDKEKVHLSDSERKMDPAEEATNVYTEKHSDNLFKRTEVLAGE